MFKKRTPELIKLVGELYLEHRSTLKVSRKLGLSPAAVYKILIDSGVEVPKRHSAEIQQRKKSLQGATAKQAAEDYANGMSLKSLSEKYKVGAYAIRTAVKDHDVQRRSIGGRWRVFSEDEKTEIKRLYIEERWSQEQLAARFKSHQVTLSRLLLSLGATTRENGRGTTSGSWNGGRTKIGQYIAIMVQPSDPMWCMAHKTGYVLEHRLVMARKLGRPLTKYETVHHIDDNKENNDPLNLQLRFGRHGKGVVLKCRCCGSSDIIPVPLAEAIPCESSS